MTNYEKYKTPVERYDAFVNRCVKHIESKEGCGKCPCYYTDSRSCAFNWLELEAEEEK